MTAARPTTVAEYLEAAPDAARDHLRRVREILKEVAPDATETIKWGVPVLEGKRILFSYSAYRKHLNFMPTGPSLDPFREELGDFKAGKDTVQLPYDRPLPESLIRRMAEHRLRDVMENDARWMR